MQFRKYKIMQHLNFYQDGTPEEVYNIYACDPRKKGLFGWIFGDHWWLMGGGGFCRDPRPEPRTLERAERLIAEDIKKQKFDLDGVHMQVKVTIERRFPYNVTWVAYSDGNYYVEFGNLKK